MRILAGRDAKFWLLSGAFLLTCAALALPQIPLRQDVYDITAVIDITGSMNTRDVEAGGRPASRLAAARTALGRLAANLPCQSRLGLGVFTERRAFLLFEPVAVCENYSAVSDAIAEVEWRMAWEGDSYIAKGLYSAIELSASLKADVLFVTDGHEAPPLPASGLPPFEGKPGEVKGLIAGAGGRTKSPIPKFDGEGREIGVYGPEDVAQDNRHGLPSAGAAGAEGWHPRNAPFGAKAAAGDEHLSSLREEHLRTLAGATGLGYATLADEPDLLDAVRRSMRKRAVITATDIGVYPAILALGLLAALYAGMPLLRRFRQPSAFTPSERAY